MNIKTFIYNFTHDQYKYGFFENNKRSKKIRNAYYKIILKIFNPIIIYLLGLFTPEIKDFLINIFKH